MICLMTRKSRQSVRLKTSFGNQMMFFANDEPNRYYELVFETDENYENLKKLYLKDALASDSTPMDRFTFLTYKQQVWPKQEFAYLNKTRSRTFFVNTSWRDARSNRTESEVNQWIWSYSSVSINVASRCSSTRLETRSLPSSST